MNMGCCLADVARRELRVLTQETKAAIHNLERQRASVIQAIQAAQEANDAPGEGPEGTDLLIMRLADRVHRLEHVLNQVAHEIEQLEANHPALETHLLIAWPVPRDLLPDERRIERDLLGDERHLPRPASFWGPPGTAITISTQLR